MDAKLLKVPPTKNTLLGLRRQVVVLEEGHELLERKRELLTRLVYERIGNYRERRRTARQALQQAYRWLAIAQMRMGGSALRQAALGTGPSLRVEILPRRALGVEYPAAEVKRLPLKPVGLLGTDASFDQTRLRLTEAAILLARLGETEMALGRLMAEQRKARKRVNALRYNIIPRYRATIRYIRAALEEEERSALFQIRLLKEQEREPM